MFVRRNTLRVVFIAVFFTFFLLLFSCDRSSNDFIVEPDDSSRRSGNGELREVNSSSSRFRALSRSDFDGEDCEEDSDCRDLCRDIFSSSNRDSCEKFPIDMVEALHETFEALENIRSPNADGIDPSAVGVIFDEEIDVFRRKFKDDWGVRGTSAFLNWVAASSSATQAMSYRNNDEALKEILLELADRHSEPQTIARALSIGLARQRETFLYFVQENDNEKALELAFKLLEEDECSNSSKNCKLLALCTRRPISGQSSTYENDSSCYYLDGYEAEDEDYCYVQGPDVWSYVQRSIRDGDVIDSDLRSEIFDTELCNRFCNRQNDCDF